MDTYPQKMSKRNISSSLHTYLSQISLVTKSSYAVVKTINFLNLFHILMMFKINNY